MVNLPPLNNDPNVLEDENAPAPEHAPIDPNPAPIQPNDYLAEEEADPKEEPKEEEEPIPEQAPTAPDGTLQALPPIRQFSGTFYVGEGSSATVFNLALSKVYPPGPMINDPVALYARVKTLTKQMWDRVRNRLPLKRRYRERPYVPSTNTTSRPRCDDPYVMVRDW
nr:hypothetical protein [Tanacetum cinerariifolium]